MTKKFSELTNQELAKAKDAIDQDILTLKAQKREIVAIEAGRLQGSLVEPKRSSEPLKTTPSVS